VRPGTSWCGGRCARNQGTHVLPPSWFTWSPLLALTRSQHFCWHQEGLRTWFIFGKYCYLKQRKFEVRTGSDMFGQVRKNPTICDPWTTPGVQSSPLLLPEPELRFVGIRGQQQCVSPPEPHERDANVEETTWRVHIVEVDDTLCRCVYRTRCTYSHLMEP
jgi:hypothetical protein